METSIKRTFLDIQKEEEWLNEQEQNGQMLIGYHGGEYVFGDISPLKYQYKIDLPSYTGSKKKEYLDFLGQVRITVMAEYRGRVYLGKSTTDGSLDMYNERKKIEKQMSRRYSYFFGIAISQLVLEILMLIQTLYYVKPEGVPFWITVVVDAGLMVSGIVFLIMRVQKHRKYAMPKKEKDTWE